MSDVLDVYKRDGRDFRLTDAYGNVLKEFITKGLDTKEAGWPIVD